MLPTFFLGRKFDSQSSGLLGDSDFADFPNPQDFSYAAKNARRVKKIWQFFCVDFLELWFHVTLEKVNRDLQLKNQKGHSLNEGKLDEHYDLFTPARMRYVTNRIIQCLVLLEEKLFIHFWTTVTKWARTSYKWSFKPWGPGLRNGENWGVLFTQWLKWNKGRKLRGWAPI